METLKKKYGPLPGYAWAAIIVGGIVLWRMRQANAAAAGSSSDTTGSGQDTAAQDYGSGYGAGETAGYQLGVNAGGTTQTAPPGSQYCRRMKAPDGHNHLVCGQGHFVRVRGGWEWLQGPKRAIIGSSRRESDRTADREAAAADARADRRRRTRR